MLITHILVQLYYPLTTKLNIKKNLNKNKMKNIPFNQDVNLIIGTNCFTTSQVKFIKPLIIKWTPKEDITTHELALCLPYLLSNRPIMPYDVDLTQTYFRHFNIIDPNK